MTNVVMADLHAHTTASDGVLSPEDLVVRAKQAGLSVLAVTDHDTMKGIARAKDKAEELGIRFLCGVEISAGSDGSTHILGYGSKDTDPQLEALFQSCRDDRIARAQKMIEKLRGFGMILNFDQIMQSARGSIGRPHIARAMVERGYAGSTQEAFEKWLGRGKPAYVARRKISVVEAISCLQRAGFVPVLAHPSQLRRDNVLLDDQTMISQLAEWKGAGLRGVEAYHPSNQNAHGCAYYDRLARSMGLLVTGGSDFHDDNDGHASLGAMAKEWRSAESDICALKEAMDDLEKQQTESKP